MAEPRDHILPLGVQLRSDMTTLANVTAKVRVNGGAATTYTNVSSPAITQNGDITYGYQVIIPASTYADGDTVEVTWLYSATPYAYADYAIGPTAVDGAHYTNTRGDNLANLDAAVSTRSTYDGSDTPGTTTLLSRLTAARAGYLDVLNGLVAAIWAAVVDSSGVTSLLGRLTSTRAGYLDSIPTIKTNTDLIPAIEAKTDLLGVGVVTYSGPVLNAENVDIVTGDDYLSVDGRALTWASDDWPSLTDASVVLEIRLTTKPHTTESYEGEVLSATEVEFELTAAETGDLRAGEWSFAIKAVLDDDSEVTLATGSMIVSEYP